MMRYANTIATWLSILAMAIGGGIWVGGQSNDLATVKNHQASTDQQVDKLRDEGPPAIARLEAQVAGIKDDVQDVKKTQEEILTELRKK